MKFSDFKLLPDNESASELRNWRIRQAIIACSSWAVVAFFVLPALLGFPYEIPKLGSVAWAMETEAKIKPLERSLSELQELLLSQSIMSAHKNWCDAYKRQEQATAWAERVRELRSDYYRHVGRAFELPNCRAL
jgi:hypothetical protein